MDDAQLLAAGARGDADAFATFYRRHLPRVIAFALRAAGDRELAADLTAEVFAVALVSARRYQAQGPSALPWLLGIANNKLRESRRRGRVENLTRRRLQMNAIALGEADLDAVGALAAAGADAVLAAIDDLPEGERRAIRARFVDERPYPEIAAELQCSESVVRQRVSRGLARARARLSPSEEA